MIRLRCFSLSPNRVAHATRSNARHAVADLHPPRHLDLADTAADHPSQRLGPQHDRERQAVPRLRTEGTQRGVRPAVSGAPSHHALLQYDVCWVLHVCAHAMHRHQDSTSDGRVSRADEVDGPAPHPRARVPAAIRQQERDPQSRSGHRVRGRRPKRAALPDRGFGSTQAPTRRRTARSALRDRQKRVRHTHLPPSRAIARTRTGDSLGTSRRASTRRPRRRFLRAQRSAAPSAAIRTSLPVRAVLLRR